ncbi:unnamed protein product, partial [marine sediment metagenome]
EELDDEKAESQDELQEDELDDEPSTMTRNSISVTRSFQKGSWHTTNKRASVSSAAVLFRLQLTK